MTVKRILDNEEYYNDKFYSTNIITNISEIEDVIQPSIRYNFYRTSDIKAYAFDNDIVNVFKPKYSFNAIFQEKGFYIIKTIYYKNLDIDTIKEILDFYIGLGYKFNGNNFYIETLEKHIENFNPNLNIRLVYFISEDLIKKYSIIPIDNFIITDNLRKVIEDREVRDVRKEIEEKGLVCRLFYVDNMTNKPVKKIKINDKIKLDVPVIRDTDNSEGLHMAVGKNEFSLNKFIGDVRDSITEVSDKLATAVDDIVNTKVTDDLTLRKEIRKIAYEKYKDIIELVKLDTKFKNEKELLKFKSNLERSKYEEEARLMREKAMYEHQAREFKYEQQQTSSLLGFARDILKLL